MLEFLRKSYRLIAPISGKVIDITAVPDEIFAQKMAGDGLAVDGSGDIVVAPADGRLTLIFKTNHAFGMLLDNEIELLVHIGLDTVNLNGKGFERLAEEGQRVRVGEPIIRIDRDLILSSGCSLITPVLITNSDAVKCMEKNCGAVVTAGTDTIMEYKIK